MTIREHLHQKLRHVKTVKLAGFAVFAFVVIFTAKAEGRNLVFATIAIAGFVVAFAGGIFIQAKVCCPKCGKSVGKFLVRDGNTWPGGQFDYCPYCGVSLDSELKILDEIPLPCPLNDPR